MQYADSNTSEQVDYIDDAQIYEDDHEEDRGHNTYDYDSTNDYNKEGKEYYHYRDDGPDHHPEGHSGNMW